MVGCSLPFLIVSQFDDLQGPGYKTDEVFNLSTMQPYNLQQLLDPFRNYSENVVLYLPRTSDMRQLANATNGDKKTVVMHYCMEGASKVGFGSIDFNSAS